MKINKLLLITSLFTLISCNNNSHSSTLSSLNPSSQESSFSFKDPFVSEEGGYSKADQERIESILGTSLPYVHDAKSYTLNQADSSNAKCLIIDFLEVKNIASAYLIFQNELEGLGFELLVANLDNELIDFGQMIIGHDLIQVVHYMEGTTLKVEAYIYYNVAVDVEEESTWPNKEILEFTNNIVVPEYNPTGNTGYNYAFGKDSYGPYMMISLLKSPANAVEEYTTILEENEYKIDGSYYETTGTMIAVDKTNHIKLYYRMVDNNLEISITLIETGTVVDTRPDGGGESSEMTPIISRPDTYRHENLHGFILDDINKNEEENIAHHAADILLDGTYDVTNTKKFAFDVQCGAFYGGKYYFFTTDYQFGYANYSEEEGYTSTYVSASINPIVNSIFNEGYYLVPLDMSFNYGDDKMYVLWAKWGLEDTDNDGYYDALHSDGFEDQYISTFNLNTFEAGKFKTIERKTSNKSTVLTGIAFNKDGDMYGLAHTSECLARVYFDTELDAYYLEHYENRLGKHPDGKMWMFYEYFHGSLAFDLHTNKLYYSWSDHGHHEIDSSSGFPESVWTGSLGGIMEINLETGLATQHIYTYAYEITGLFSVYYE